MRSGFSRPERPVSQLVRKVAVAAAYPVVWGAGQLVTGWLSDRAGRKPLIVAALTAASGLAVAATSWQSRPSRNPNPVEGGRRWQAMARS